MARTDHIIGGILLIKRASAVVLMFKSKAYLKHWKTEVGGFGVDPFDLLVKIILFLPPLVLFLRDSLAKLNLCKCKTSISLYTHHTNLKFTNQNQRLQQLPENQHFLYFVLFDWKSLCHSLLLQTSMWVNDVMISWCLWSQNMLWWWNGRLWG